MTVADLEREAAAKHREYEQKTKEKEAATEEVGAGIKGEERKSVL